MEEEFLHCTKTPQHLHRRLLKLQYEDPLLNDKGYTTLKVVRPFIDHLCSVKSFAKYMYIPLKTRDLKWKKKTQTTNWMNKQRPKLPTCGGDIYHKL